MNAVDLVLRWSFAAALIAAGICALVLQLIRYREEIVEIERDMRHMRMSHERVWEPDNETGS